MPLYEYKCLKCARRTEKIEGFSGPHLKKCPHCGGKVERLVSAPAIQFKGSGWYVTDYGGKSAGSDSAKSEKAEAAEGKAADAKTGDTKAGDAKPAKETKESKESAQGKDSKKKAPAKKEK